MGHSFHMSGVHTDWITAEMVKFKTQGNRPKDQLICVLMGEEVTSEDSVTLIVDRSEPPKAQGRESHILLNPKRITPLNADRSPSVSSQEPLVFTLDPPEMPIVLLAYGGHKTASTVAKSARVWWYTLLVHAVLLIRMVLKGRGLRGLRPTYSTGTA